MEFTSGQIYLTGHISLVGFILFGFNLLSSRAFLPVPEDSGVGQLNALQPFVFGGRDSSADKFPYIASLRQPSDGQHFCTGALVAQTVVLTSAHCLEPRLGGYEQPLVDFYRTCTSCDDESGVRRVAVSTSIKHPNWSGEVRDGADLALLVLSESLEGPYLRVLPQQDPAQAFGDLQSFQFAGYGLVREEQVSVTLQEVELFYRRQGFCRQLYQTLGYEFKPEDTICATGLGRAELCRGDSGGPLILKGATPDEDFAVGILSGGSPGCGVDVQLPALFTNLYLYQNDLRFYIPETFPGPVSPVQTPPPPPAPVQMAASTTKQQERSALLALLAENSDVSRLSGWDAGSDLCEWTGIRCDSEGHVQKVLFPGPGDALRGTLPREWSALSRLEEINLRFNGLEGTLPQDWSALTRLQMLFIPGNRLSGTLPREWSTMTNMETLALFTNQITGTLPPEWSELRKATSLYLLSNRLTGTVPGPWLSGMSSLERLLLQGNRVAAPRQSLSDGLSVLV